MGSYRNTESGELRGEVEMLSRVGVSGRRSKLDCWNSLTEVQVF